MGSTDHTLTRARPRRRRVCQPSGPRQGWRFGGTARRCGGAHPNPSPRREPNLREGPVTVCVRALTSDDTGKTLTPAASCKLASMTASTGVSCRPMGAHPPPVAAPVRRQTAWIPAAPAPALCGLALTMPEDTVPMRRDGPYCRHQFGDSTAPVARLRKNTGLGTPSPRIDRSSWARSVL